MDIKIVNATRRPCYVGEERAMFNCWSQESYVVGPSMLVGGHNGGTVSGVRGVVEFDNGGVSLVYPDQIRFADGGGFEDYAWLPATTSDKEETKNR